MEIFLDLFLVSILFSESLGETVTGGNDLSFGVFNLPELDSKSYELGIDASPLTETILLSEEKKELLENENMVRVFSKRGQEFVCFLPSDIPETKEDIVMDDESFLDIPGLLTQLKRRCILANQGWWSYKYCHGNNVTQFHVEGGRVVGDIISLGVFDSEDEWTQQKLRNSMERQMKNRVLKEHNVAKLSSHNAKYINGTACDINTIRRAVTARITCSPYHTDTEIVRITEHETCNYTFVIHSPQLCDHPLFRLDSAEPTDVIKCSPLLSDKQYRRHSSKIEAMKARSDVKDALQKNLVKERKTKEKEIPLMDVLHSLATSIADKVTSERGDLLPSGDEKEIDKETEEMIDNLVSETLSNVFGNKREGNEASKSVSDDNTIKRTDAEKENDKFKKDDADNTDSAENSVSDDTIERQAASKRNAERSSDAAHDEAANQQTETLTEDGGTSQPLKEDDGLSSAAGATETLDDDLEDINDNEKGKKEKKEKFRVYHIKLSDQSSFDKEDLDEIVDEVASKDPGFKDGDKSSSKVIEIDLSKKKKTSSLLAQAIEQFMESDESSDGELKQKKLEENYGNTWDEEKDDER